MSSIRTYALAPLVCLALLFACNTPSIPIPPPQREAIDFEHDDMGGTATFSYTIPRADFAFAVVYVLVSHAHNQRLILKTYLDPSIDTSGIEPDPALELDSVTNIWPGAEWTEREVYDFFGIRFRNHPDLRRILMWKDYPAHPLRKDYPLRGRGERE